MGAVIVRATGHFLIAAAISRSILAARTFSGLLVGTTTAVRPLLNIGISQPCFTATASINPLIATAAVVKLFFATMTSFVSLLTATGPGLAGPTNLTSELLVFGFVSRATIGSVINVS